MAMRNPPSYLAAATQQHTAQNDRLTQAAAYRTLDGVRTVSGILAGPAGTMGELTLVSDTVLRVNPFRAAIQSTQDSKQGAYTVTNDEAANLTITGRHASQYRRSLVLVYVADSVVSGVASSGSTDGTFLTILDGPLAASNPALPSAIPPNALLLGEVSIPPVGVGAVSMTPYNPRTTLRGGILPVLASDTTAGLTVGDYRHHPTRGLQQWNGSAWLMVGSRHLCDAHLATTAGSIPANAWTPLFFDIASFDPYSGFSGGSYIAPFTGWYRCTATIVYMPNGTGIRLVQWQRTTGAPVSGSPVFVRGTASGTPGTVGINTPVQSSYAIFCNAGERLTVTGYQNSGGTLPVSGSPSGTDQITAMTIDLLEQTA